MKIIYIESKIYGTQECLVDDLDYEYLNQFKWTLCKHKGCNTYYVATRNKSSNKLSFIHRVILSINNPKSHIDHIDHNGLNNQRNNLRQVTNSQNQMNRQKISNKTSIYKGVYLHKRAYKNTEYKKWNAQITINKKPIFLGSFTSEKEAAIVYNNAAIIHFKEYAHLNKID